MGHVSQDKSQASGKAAGQGNFMEELLTTVILICFNVALDANGAFSPKSKAPTYDEVERRTNITEVRPSYLHRSAEIRPPSAIRRLDSGRADFRTPL
jgi:hypothetical protein